MFIGEYIHTIDHKRRLAIPSKFRKSLGKKAVVAQGLDKCLVIYPIDEWNKKASKLENLPDGQMQARTFARLILSGASDAELDNLGRVLIPEHLKEYASLERNVAVLGLSNRIELWNQDKWQAYKKEKEKAVEDLAQQLDI
ncbi:MAG: division/cell wall cluster transcriptional repressor MraZ [Candidatus Nealsonbacteria bacterium]